MGLGFRNKRKLRLGLLNTSILGIFIFLIGLGFLIVIVLGIWISNSTTLGTRASSKEGEREESAVEILLCKIRSLLIADRFCMQASCQQQKN